MNVEQMPRHRTIQYTKLEQKHNKLESLLYEYADKKIAFEDSKDKHDKAKLVKVNNELKELLNNDSLVKKLQREVQKFIRSLDNISCYDEIYDNAFDKFKNHTIVLLADSVFNTIELRKQRDKEEAEFQKELEEYAEKIFQNQEIEYQEYLKNKNQASTNIIENTTYQFVSPNLRLYAF